MLVQTLIEMLSKFDPNLPVYGYWEGPIDDASEDIELKEADGDLPKRVVIWAQKTPGA